MGVLDLTAPAAPERDPTVFASEVQRELEALQRRERSAGERLLILITSLVLFVSFHLISTSASGVAILVFVLLVHECGHLVAMKMSGYGDVQMFFIPFFGAAVSGSERVPSGTRRAIVALAGPAPGIAIGACCLVAYAETGIAVLWDAGRAFLALNAFNLLPIMPLDGGRFLEVVVFSRRPGLKAVFDLAAALGLAAFSWSAGSVVLGVLALLMFGTVHAMYTWGQVARDFKAELVHDAAAPLAAAPGIAPEAMPVEYIERLLPHIERHLAEPHRTARNVARVLRGVWDMVRLEPPSIPASVLLLGAYAACAAVGAFLTLRPFDLLFLLVS